MKRHAGQAGRVAGDLLHRLGRLILLAVTLVLLGLCVLALRLAQGPVEIPYLASHLATAVSGQGITVHMQRAELAWAGFHEGGEVPLYLALGGIDISNATGLTLASIPRARLVFSPDALFGGGLPILVTGEGATFNGSAVPVSLTAGVQLDLGFSLARADIAVHLGAGRLGTGGLSEPISAGVFRLVFTPTRATLSDGRLSLAPSGASTPHVSFTATASRAAQWSFVLHIAADAVAATDLQNYWPPAALPPTRAWVLTHITAGTATHGAFTVAGTAPRTLARIAVTAASGGFAASGLTMYWLAKAAPITGLNGAFALTDLDDILITATAGHVGNISFTAGKMAITGLREHKQAGDLTLPLAGRVEDAMAILGAPPLSLLKRAPAGVAQASGDFTGQLTARFPFIQKLGIRQVDLHVDLALTNTTVPVPLLGLAFTNGTASLHATTSGLAIAGDVDFAGGPCHAGLHATFKGPDTLHDAALACTAGPALLHRFGLDASNPIFDPVTGTITYDASVVTAPDGSQTGQLDTDFTAATLNAPRLAWRKEAGVPGHLSVTASMANDALTGLSAIAAAAPGLAVRAAATGHRVTVSQAKIGGTDLAGSITVPAGKAPWIADFAGPTLVFILSPPAVKAASGSAAKNIPTPPAAKPAGKPALPSGPLWQAHLTVASATLAATPAPALNRFTLVAAGQGAALQSAHLQASGIDAHLSQPTPPHEALAITSPDAGFLFAALGASRRIQGGNLALDAGWTPGSPIGGHLTIESFSLLNAPAFTKIMQGLTLYGVGEATAGPGLKFSTLDASFSLEGNTITLNDARAYSASLGFTAAGTVGLNGGGLHLNATIIPAYALNALPGKIPVVGKLFTAQKGGGLFALNAHVTGPLDNPTVRINPLSALTPGIIRRIFGY